MLKSDVSIKGLYTICNISLQMEQQKRYLQFSVNC